MSGRIRAAVEGLLHALSGPYVTRFAELANVPGTVTVVVLAPEAPELGHDGPCPPGPAQLECQLLIVAASSDARGVWELLDHIDPVAERAAAAGWTVGPVTTSPVDDRPAYSIRLTRSGVM